MFLLEPDKEIQTGGCWKGTLFSYPVPGMGMGWFGLATYPGRYRVGSRTLTGVGIASQYRL